MRFRGDSIWENGQVGPLVSTAAGPRTNTVSWGTQTEQPHLPLEMATVDTRTHTSTLPNKVAPVGTQAGAPPSPVDIPLLMLSPLSPLLMYPPLSPARPAAATTTTSRLAVGTQTEMEVLSTKTEAPSHHITAPLLPLLLLLLSAFLFALQADRLAAEREVWAAANDTTRGLVTAWSGEWWSGGIGEWIRWEVERLIGVERRLTG